MRVLLTSAGLETEEIKECFVDMAGKEMSLVKALFIPTAAIDADAIEVLPKCMNDLLKCGILGKNIDVFDLHAGMEFEKLQQYDVVYLCGGNTRYLLERINATRFHKSLMEYINDNGLVIGVSAGSLIFSNNIEDFNEAYLLEIQGEKYNCVIIYYKFFFPLFLPLREFET